jgi:thymidylate synthase
VPQIWKDIADKDGNINSNYGWCIFSDENNNQFNHAVGALIKNEDTRQAVMIYTRPTMHQEATYNGRYDFLCTNTVQLIIRDGVMHYVVNMRSSDAVFGYKGDRAWHDFVFDKAIEKYSKPVAKGNIIWNAVSLHVYPRHEKLVQEWSNEQV